MVIGKEEESYYDARDPEEPSGDKDEDDDDTNDQGDVPGGDAPREEAPPSPPAPAPPPPDPEPPGPGEEPEPEPGPSGEDQKKEKRKKEEKEKCEICGRFFATIGPECFVIHAQEPWPKEVLLYQPYEVEQILLPESANCLAVQAFLKMCNLEFSVVSKANAEAMSPSGKVPFIKCGAFVVSELEGIVQFVNSKGVSLTSDMDKEAKSDMRAYMSLIHNVLESAENYICWLDKETYNQVTKPRAGSVYPFPLNYFKTWDKKSAEVKKLKLLGWANKSLENVYEEVENCCQALTDRLESKEYFFGKKSEFDALVYGHLSSILMTPLPNDDNELAKRINNFNKLVDFCKRFDKEVMGTENSYEVGSYVKPEKKRKKEEKPIDETQAEESSPEEPQEEKFDYNPPTQTETTTDTEAVSENTEVKTETVTDTANEDDDDDD